MADAEPEKYSIRIDASVGSKDALFSRVTDTAYLGHGSFSGRDGFEDMFHGRLQGGDIKIDIDNYDLSGAPKHDRSTWLELLNHVQSESPEKLRLVRSNRKFE